MATHLLSQNEYLRTMSHEMTPIDNEAIGERLLHYLNSIPDEELQGQTFTRWKLERTYINRGRSYKHFLFPSQDKNIFLALVVEVKSMSVVGHYLLDLNEQYGLL